MNRNNDGALTAGTSRRAFLQALGIGSAASLAACSRWPIKEAIPYLIPAEEITPGVPVLYASTCTACPASCGMRVTVRDGRPIKLEGEPDHPLSRGGLCAVGQADIRALYHPGRQQRPSVDGRDASWGDLDRAVVSSLDAATATGKPIWLLTSSLVSPTARLAVGRFAATHGARHVEWEACPGNPSAMLEAGPTYAGHAALPAYDLEAADMWLSFASDLLGVGPEPVAHTAAWAARRAAAGERGLARHVQIEGAMSLTGANADERLRASAAERRLLAFWLLRRVAERSHHVEAAATAALLTELPETSRRADLDALAEELAHHRDRSLVTCGDDDPGTQLAVALTNQLLGNTGTTVSIEAPSLVRRGRDRAVAELRDALVAGDVGGLVTVRCDPVGTLPGGDALAGAIEALPLSVAIAVRPSATTAACRLVAAAHHGLESWSDAEVRPGLRTIAQPTVRPLFDTRPAFENLLRWSGGDTIDWRHEVEASWRRHSDTPWREAVARAGLGAAAVTPATGAESPTAEASRDALRADLARGFEETAETEVELIAEVALRDGGPSHVPWLRELPDPLTRVAWTACARVAPERARDLGIVDGDSIALTTASGARVKMPAVLAPGQDPRVIAVPLGYGLIAGEEPDTNGFRLGAFDGGVWRRTAPADVKRAAGRVELPRIQNETSPHGRPIIYQLGDLDQEVHPPHAPDANLWTDRTQTSPQWAMTLNLDACTGCSACVVACQAENNIPVVGPEEVARHREMSWLRIDRYDVGDGENPDTLFEPMLCAQCDDAPCETVCPVLATVHSTDGLNQQIYNRCVGTRYCANNCPYKVRRFNWFNYQPSDPLERMVLNPDVVVRSRGVMEKCTFCVQRIQRQRIAARKDGRDTFAVAPACQQSCPAGAIHFGDRTDPEAEVSKRATRPNAFQVLAELGTRPSVTYLARYRNRAGVGHSSTDHAAAGHDEEHS